MAYFEMHYKSEALLMQVTVGVIIPDVKKDEGERCYKTLYLLHGLSDDQTMWMRRTSIERYAEEWGIAVVMPSVARSWYTDTAYGAKYFTFVSEELPRVCRSYFSGMSDKREDNFIAGLSMGGYGAFKIALTYPERFGGCASLSGAHDLFRENAFKFNREWRGNFGFDIPTSDELLGTKHDVFWLADKAKASGKELPRMFLWCGESDFLLEGNRRLDAYLTELGIDHVYRESEGDHSWQWWDKHITDAIDSIMGK